MHSSVREKIKCNPFNRQDAILPIAELLSIQGIKSKNPKYRSALHQMRSCCASFFVVATIPVYSTFKYSKIFIFFSFLSLLLLFSPSLILSFLSCTPKSQTIRQMPASSETDLKHTVICCRDKASDVEAFILSI